jgi:hypothetical protein
MTYVQNTQVISISHEHFRLVEPPVNTEESNHTQAPRQHNSYLLWPPFVQKEKKKDKNSIFKPI